MATGRIEKGGRGYAHTIFSLFLGSFVTYAILYNVQALMPTFSRHFHVSAAMASLSLSLTTAVLAVSMLVASAVSDAIGRKPIMVFSLLLAAILAVATACSPNFGFLLVVRAFTGAALAGYPSIAMTYINEEFHPRSLASVMGVYISGTSLGGLSSRVIVDALTDWFSWRVALGSVAALCLLVSLWFWRNLPASSHFSPRSGGLKKLWSSLALHLKNPRLLCLYGLAFVLMGSFVSLYNYIAYPMMAPPYDLSQTLVGLIFLIYLVGTFSSAFMGKMADRHGKAKTLALSISIMLAGALVTLHGALAIKLIGIALYTFGFFGAHAIASSLVGLHARDIKAQASSLYLFFYYAGSSLIGTSGGVFWSALGWGGVIGMIGVLLLFALLLARIFLWLEKRSAKIPLDPPFSKGEGKTR